MIDLVRSYRARGHLWAHIDPLGYAPEPHAELELPHFGFTLWDLDRKFMSAGLAGSTSAAAPADPRHAARDLLRHIGAEYMHIPEPEIDAGCRSGWSGRRTPSR